MKPFCFAGDNIVDSEKASLHPLDIGLIRGYAVFDFFRTVDYVPLFLEDYLDRFVQSAAKAHLHLPFDENQLKRIVLELIEKNDLKQGGIRMILSGGVAENHFSPDHGSLFIFCEELLMPSNEKYSKGVHLLTAEYIRPIPEIKTTNYALPVYLSANWKANGAEDVLYYANGVVSESSRSNVFIVKKDVISTPQSNILKGITRKNILELAPHTQIRDITLEEVMAADEVFMSSTTKRILPITKIDHKPIGTGEVGKHTLRLMDLFKNMENEKAL